MTDGVFLARACSKMLKTSGVAGLFRVNPQQVRGQIIPTGESE